MSNPDLSAARIIEQLQLVPLEFEGGFFSKTYGSQIRISQENLPDRFNGERSISSHIYFFLTDEEGCFSAMHRNLADEMYHYYLGDPVELLLLFPDGKSEVVVLGSDILNGEKVQFLVPHGVWQGSRLKPGGKFALMGTSMSPAFEWEDFELGDRDSLSDQYDEQKDLIAKLTRVSV